MHKYFIPILFCLLCSGCLDPKVDAKADVKTDVESLVKAEVSAARVELENQIDTKINSHFEASLNNKIDNKMDTKINLLGSDIKQKVADELRAEIQTQIETHTQNTGMFSGGAIYVSAVAIVIILCIFGTFIWLIKSVMKWKKIWHILSTCIEENQSSKEIKQDFNNRVHAAGLKGHVDKNLENRGLKKKIKG